MKFKVIKEYSRFYLAESKKGYKETFEKYKYKPDENGYIYKESEDNYKGGEGLPSDKVNRIFNCTGKYKKGRK